MNIVKNRQTDPRAFGCPTPKANLTFVADEDGAAILDLERGMLSELNPTGAYIWQRLQSGDSVELIVAGLEAKTGMSTSIVARDVQRFLDTLCAAGMIET